MDTDWLTTEEVMAYLNVSKSLVWKLTSPTTQRLRTKKQGAKLLICRQSVDEYNRLRHDKVQCPEGWLTPTQAGEVLGLSTNRIYELVRDGKITRRPLRDFGIVAYHQRYLVSMADVLACAEEGLGQRLEHGPYCPRCGVYVGYTPPDLCGLCQYEKQTGHIYICREPIPGFASGCIERSILFQK